MQRSQWLFVLGIIVVNVVVLLFFQKSEVNTVNSMNTELSATQTNQLRWTPTGSITATATDKNSIMHRLSHREDFFPALEYLYSKYGAEIGKHRPFMRKWCKKSFSCKFCDYEAEMLYMLIREVSPRRVFEMAPNVGYSSHWILHALKMNDETSILTSIDIHNKSVSYMTRSYASRWKFQLGDFREQLRDGRLDMNEFDFIFIDALHTEEFARSYVEHLLLPRRQPVIVAIHDIVANDDRGGRESNSIYTYLSFANNVQNVFTMSNKTMPGVYHAIPDAVVRLNQIRAKYGVVKPCDSAGADCSSSLHDNLYFPINSSPTIFFTLNM